MFSCLSRSSSNFFQCFPCSTSWPSATTPAPPCKSSSAAQCQTTTSSTYPTNNAPLNKFWLSSKKSAASFLEQNLGQILLIWKHTVWHQKRTKPVWKMYYSTFLLSFHFASHPCWLGTRTVKTRIIGTGRELPRNFPGYPIFHVDL